MSQTPLSAAEASALLASLEAAHGPGVLCALVGAGLVADARALVAEVRAEALAEGDTPHEGEGPWFNAREWLSDFDLPSWAYVEGEAAGVIWG